MDLIIWFLICLDCWNNQSGRSETLRGRRIPEPVRKDQFGYADTFFARL